MSVSTFLYNSSQSLNCLTPWDVRIVFFCGRRKYKAQTQGRQSLLDFFFKKKLFTTRHLGRCLALTRRFLSLPRRRSTENYLRDKMLINEWETVFNDLSIYRN